MIGITHQLHQLRPPPSIGAGSPSHILAAHLRPLRAPFLAGRVPATRVISRKESDPNPRPSPMSCRAASSRCARVRCLRSTRVIGDSSSAGLACAGSAGGMDGVGPLVVDEYRRGVLRDWLGLLMSVSKARHEHRSHGCFHDKHSPAEAPTKAKLSTSIAAIPREARQEHRSHGCSHEKPGESIAGPLPRETRARPSLRIGLTSPPV